MAEPDDLPAGYPRAWVADVVLTDGGTARLRPIRPDDRRLLIDFYARVSAESKFLRFFAPYPVLTERDVDRFTRVDYVDRVALIITIGDRMVAVGRYDRLDNDEAEVAFLVEDSQQGRGVGQLLLEHLAEAARERGITRFVAEVLPHNSRMVTVFAEAGFKVARQFEDGVILVDFAIAPTDTSVGVMERREHRAESSSIRRLLQPERVLLHGPARRLQPYLDSLVGGGFTGSLLAVSTDGEPVSGAEQLAQISSLTEPIDLAVVALERGQLADAVIDVAHQGAHGLLVLAGEEATDADAAHLVGLARSYGLRALGPDALGLVNSDPGVRLNASPVSAPRAGSVGIFCQSAAVAVMLFSAARRLGVGISQFISTGTYADVTGNDVMQFWEDDEATSVCLLSLDRIGNPRKFSRIIRRLARRKPVIVFAPSRAELADRAGVVEGLSAAPPEAIDALFRQSGVVVMDRRQPMFDTAKLLVRQPLPRCVRVRAVTNSRALSAQVDGALRRAGLVPVESFVVAGRADADRIAERTAAALADDECDSVLVVTVGIFPADVRASYRALTELARTSGKPLLAAFIDFAELGQLTDGPDGPGELPVFSGYGDAVPALAAVTAYAHWRDRDPGAVPDIDPDLDGARRIVREALRCAPHGSTLDLAATTELLRCFRINLVPRYPVASSEEAIRVARSLGWNVVLKATAEAVRGRPDLASVRRYLDSPTEIIDAWDELGRLVESLGLGGPHDQHLAAPVVQAMMPTGVSLQVAANEDPAFGPVISFGLAGVTSELLGDLAYRVPPITDVDASLMVRELRGSPLLFGRHGSRGVDVEAVEQLVLKVSQLADQLPQVSRVMLTPCLATADGVSVLGASVQLLPLADHRDARARMLG